MIDRNGDPDALLTLTIQCQSGVEKRLKLSGLNKLKQFIAKNKPNAIVLGGESVDAIYMKKDLEAVCGELEAEGAVPRRIPVELMDTELTKAYAVESGKEHDLDDYFVMRGATSLARRLQDPLIEFCQLCTPNKEILRLCTNRSKDCMHISSGDRILFRAGGRPHVEVLKAPSGNQSEVLYPAKFRMGGYSPPGTAPAYGN